VNVSTLPSWTSAIFKQAKNEFQSYHYMLLYLLFKCYFTLL
jgi:hypothetical protein